MKSETDYSDDDTKILNSKVMKSRSDWYCFETWIQNEHNIIHKLKLHIKFSAINKPEIRIYIIWEIKTSRDSTSQTNPRHTFETGLRSPPTNKTITVNHVTDLVVRVIVIGDETIADWWMNTVSIPETIKRRNWLRQRT